MIQLMPGFLKNNGGLLFRKIKKVKFEFKTKIKTLDKIFNNNKAITPCPFGGHCQILCPLNEISTFLLCVRMKM